MSTWGSTGAPPAAWQGPGIEELQTAANPLTSGSCVFKRAEPALFDVSQGRTILVDMTDIYTIMDRIESARKELVEHIRNYLAPSDRARAEDNPVSIYLPNLQVRLPK